MAGNSLAFHRLTPESLYWLGWLATDGCIDWHNGWRIRLELHSIDCFLLERFAFFLGAKPPKPNKRNHYSVALSNNIMGSRLRELGIIERKSFSSLRINDLDVVRSPYFWRGAFEGDGGWYEDKRGDLVAHLTSSSRVFLEQFQLFYGACQIVPNNSSWRLFSYSGNARRLLKLLYDGSYPNLALERKQPLVLKWAR